jgi:hypothetical protein
VQAVGGCENTPVTPEEIFQAIWRLISELTSDWIRRNGTAGLSATGSKLTSVLGYRIFASSCFTTTGRSDLPCMKSSNPAPVTPTSRLPPDRLSANPLARLAVTASVAFSPGYGG